jgi:hypothetical protein
LINLAIDGHNFELARKIQLELVESHLNICGGWIGSIKKLTEFLERGNQSPVTGLSFNIPQNPSGPPPSRPPPIPMQNQFVPNIAPPPTRTSAPQTMNAANITGPPPTNFPPRPFNPPQ